MHQLRSWGVDLRKIWLHQGHVSWPIFWSFFVIFGFIGFEQLFDPAEVGTHSEHPGDVFERPVCSSGAQSLGDFST